ncbi:hypothetical protein AAFF_G00089290 [Aldrovandia affinis]|uniref:Uncharacterized protein n=1 Tax=Aldrovandia affinis TaxID=143900 RepID=A0AAD7WCF7_9TELE|nr:hypothetical protein AAFF_G00089290 [Aldrovandia affinis]
MFRIEGTQRHAAIGLIGATYITRGDGLGGRERGEEGQSGRDRVTQCSICFNVRNDRRGLIDSSSAFFTSCPRFLSTQTVTGERSAKRKAVKHPGETKAKNKRDHRLDTQRKIFFALRSTAVGRALHDRELTSARPLY